MKELAILHFENLGAWERNLYALAIFLGVDAIYINARTPGLTAERLRAELSGARGVAMSAATACVLEDGNLLCALDPSAGNALTGVLIYGYQPDIQHAALASRLTSSAACGIEPVRDAARCSFPRDCRTHARQLAGCDFEREPDPADCCFRLELSPGVETLMEMAGQAAFIRTTNGGVPWFHWTGVGEIANPSTRTGGGELPRWCDRFVPPIMFLRAVFPDSLWENPVKTARVIIDDPLLEWTYGFLRYNDLVHSLARLRYGVTTAFIPWNYLRTTREAARFFAEHVPAHSICVHGCDHTNNEFGVTDLELLTRKAVVALRRMAEHQQRTGLPYDAVMVFPQGRFSTIAMQALRRAGFLAVVNLARSPTDSSDPGLMLGEELLPATNCRSGLPIFMRRYPKKLSAYALDLFLGKPALIVEHHDWFAQGCGELERCVQFLQEVEPNLSWPSLSDGLQRQHWRRRGDQGAWQIRFFTPTFEFENPESEPGVFVFTKAEPEPCLVESVTVEGKRVAFAHDKGMVTFTCELGSKQKVLIKLNDRPPVVSQEWAPGLRYRAQVRLRRILSEVRDNQLAKHPRLLGVARQIVRSLKWSTDAEAAN